MPASAHARNFSDSNTRWIDRVIADKNLSPKAKHLGHVLNYLAIDDIVAERLAVLGEMTGIRSAGAVLKARRELEVRQHIRVNRKSGKCKSVRLVAEVAQ